MGEQISVDHFRVVGFSVDSVTGNMAHFVRSPEVHKAALEDFFRRTESNYGRFNYLGEWHSHPSFPALPSGADRASMQSLVESERDIHFSVLLIVRLRWLLKFECSATLFVRHAPSKPIMVS